MATKSTKDLMDRNIKFTTQLIVFVLFVAFVIQSLCGLCDSIFLLKGFNINSCALIEF